MFEEVKQLSQHFLKIKHQPYQRYFIETAVFSEQLSIIIGQRGVGKTTTLIQHLLDQTKGDHFSPDILYVQADHFLVGNYSLYDIAKQFSLHSGKVIAFDEIHKYKNWSGELKSIYDTFSQLKIFASGSSALEIHKGSHDLSRRTVIYKMYGLSFREYLELYYNLKLNYFSLDAILEQHQKLASQIIKQLSKTPKTVLSHFNDYLRHGYYPYFKDLKDKKTYPLLLEQNLHTTIESDLVSIYPHLTGNSVKKIKQLLAYIAHEVPFVPQWQKIKNIVGIADTRTLKTYFKYLEDAGIIHLLSSASQKMRSIENPEKIYLNNPNQIYAFSYDHPNKGTLRETFFYNILSTRHSLTLPKDGDFLADQKYLFEVGGKKKGFSQIASHQQAYLACDDIETGINNKIPLWLFGFLY